MNTDEAHLLQLHLAEHDAPCPVCNARLGGTAAARCPACGAGLRLRVGSIDLRLGGWIMTLVGLSMSLGMVMFSSVVGVSGLIWEAATTTSTRPFRAQTGWGMALPLLGMFALLGLLATLSWTLVRRRKRFLKRPRPWQILVASVALISIVPATALIVALFTAIWS